VTMAAQRRVVAIAITIAGLSAPTWVAAQGAPEAAALRLRSLAATCSACHGTDGRSVSDAALPGLAGMPASYLIEQMKSFKSGARPGTVMPQLAKGFSDAQIVQIAAWFATAPAAPR
jgi:cytochrome subunit of sulfide dehydrogenase